MNKIKNFFFNKVEKNQPTTLTNLVVSLLYGVLKVFIVFQIYLFISITPFLLTNMEINENPIENKGFIGLLILNIVSFLAFTLYIFLNRLPNQIRVFKNYLKTNTVVNQEFLNNNIHEKLKNMNFDGYREKIYFKNGKKEVHYTFDQLGIIGNLYNNDLIWFEGLKNWTKVSEIEELSSIALSEPPLTQKEKNILSFKKSLKPSILIYLIFSLFIGISSGLLEKFQYNKFFEEVNTNSIQNQKDEDKVQAKLNEEDSEYMSALAKNKPSFSSHSNIRTDEIYATDSDGQYYTRWKSYLPVRGTDQEQISYNAKHRFLFRPYQAIIKHANLSREERANIGLLMANFTLSSLVTNLLLLPLIILVYL